MLETATSSAASIRVPADLFIAGRIADANKKLHNNMLSVKELASRTWAGQDVGMIKRGYADGETRSQLPTASQEKVSSWKVPVKTLE